MTTRGKTYAELSPLERTEAGIAFAHADGKTAQQIAAKRRMPIAEVDAVLKRQAAGRKATRAAWIESQRIVLPESPPSNICGACFALFTKQAYAARDEGLLEHRAATCAHPHAGMAAENYRVAFVMQDPPRWCELFNVDLTKWLSLYRRLVRDNGFALSPAEQRAKQLREGAVIVYESARVLVTAKGRR
jgi:hypothetical protein